MPALKLLGFDGVVPRTSATMLEANQAQRAENLKLYARELRHWDGPLPVYELGAEALTIYRLHGLPDPIWLAWSADVDVASGPLADVTESRLYMTDGVAPRKTNYAMAAAQPDLRPGVGTYAMGVPPPAAAPSAVVSGVGSGTSETRAYVYTLVTQFGSVLEESAPSPPTLATLQPGQTVTIGTFSAAPGAGYNPQKRRIYRSVTGTGSDSYQFVAELAIGTASYADNLTVAQLGAVLPTIGWLEPPATLQGLVNTPFGSIAGFVGNTVYFSEPYYPHAWPLRYALNLPHKVVGLAQIGSSMAVMTERNPFLLHGLPGAMQQESLPLVEPCISKNSIASDSYGVLYASPNGMVAIGSDFRGVVTDKLFKRSEWQALSPANIQGAVFDGKYYGNFPGDGRMLLLSRDDIPALHYLDVTANCIHVDDVDARIYFANPAGVIQQFDADPVQPLTYSWLSKRFKLPAATSFSALQVDAAYEQLAESDAYNALVAAINAANAVLFASDTLGSMNGAAINVYDVNGSALVAPPDPGAVRFLQVLVYEGSQLLATMNMSSEDPVRLPPFKMREVEIELVGNIWVRALAIGTTVAEMRG